ncbi:MAG TPA: trigger factor, partial [Ruminococcus sp.]|nr:trigger factor [Ruminococcus sp.]
EPVKAEKPKKTRAKKADAAEPVKAEKPKKTRAKKADAAAEQPKKPRIGKKNPKNDES